MLGIQCPDCGGDTKVSDSRGKDRYIWRRRKCLDCGRMITTDERISGTRRREDAERLAELLETVICDLGLREVMAERLAEKAKICA